MNKVTIDRELLENICDVVDGLEYASGFALGACDELRTALAAPRQPEGEAISLERVQAEADAFFDWPTADKSSVTTKSCLIFARCIAGMVAAERDATIAELREVNRIQLEVATVHGAACVGIRQQRDRLAQILRDLVPGCKWRVMRPRIDAALAEIDNGN